VLAELDADAMSGLILASVGVLQRAAVGDDAPIAVIGFSMGASMAMWLAARAGDAVDAVVAFYGAQAIDFDDAAARFQGHYAEHDHLVSEEDRITTEAFIRLGENDTEFHLYPGTAHWFFEQGDTFDAEAADLAWGRMVAFLAAYHPAG
jgi:carboxymethylenebutenolidase